MCLVVAAGSASAGVWLFNIDYGPNPGGDAPYEDDTLTVGPAVFNFEPDDYWNWRGGAPDDHRLLSDRTVAPGDIRWFGTGAIWDFEADEVVSDDPLLGTARSPFVGGEWVESASYSAAGLDDYIGETMWLVVYSGGDGTDKYRTVIDVGGHDPVTSTGTNSSEFIEGENYWVFEVVVNINGQVPIEISPAPGAERGLISGAQLTNAEPGTTAPVVAFDNVITTLDLLPADLSATVTGDSDDITSVDFELESVPDGVDPAEVVLVDTTEDNQNPTATMGVVTEGLYEVKLTLSGGQNDLQAIASVQFFADPCDAAQAAPGYVYNPMDLNDDCLVNLADFAIFADHWLDDTSMQAQVIYFEASEEADEYFSEPPSWAGLWFNLSNDPRDVRAMGVDFAGISGRQLWSNLEPQKGEYDFSSIKTNLEAAEETDSYWYFVLWTGPHSPEWLYDNGVPLVQTDARPYEFPYYLDEDYQNYIIALFDELAASIAGYRPELIERLAFVQPGFGSTGDRQLYKGTPDDPQYNISKEEYVDFMKEMTIAFTSAFERHESTSDVRFLWNIDDYDGSDPSQLEGRPEGKQGEMLYGAWMKENYNCQLRKQQFTIAIGYMTPNEMDQDNEQRDNFFGNTGRWGGNPEFVRGEFNDSRWADIPRAKLNQTLNYYWTSISSVDRGLDAWEIKELHEDYKEAYAFSHRYSFYKRAETSPVAFIALRDVLDYSDKSRFPENEYGQASRTNQARIDNILADYEDYGARNDDNETVKSYNQAQYLLNATGYNDCTWNVIARNYRRFITQIDANETSAGYWRVGITQDQPYGRFARGFDVENGKNTMYFDVDDQFFLGNRMEEENNLKVKIIYYAEEEGSWELQYHATDGTMKTALEVTNEVGQGWLSKEVELDDALLDNGGPRGADLVLQNTGGTNVKFHLTEVLHF